MTDEIFYYQALNYSIIVICGSLRGAASSKYQFNKEIFASKTYKGRA